MQIEYYPSRVWTLPVAQLNEVFACPVTQEFEHDEGNFEQNQPTTFPDTYSGDPFSSSITFLDIAALRPIYYANVHRG